MFGLSDAEKKAKELSNLRAAVTALDEAIMANTRKRLTIKAEGEKLTQAYEQKRQELAEYMKSNPV